MATTALSGVFSSIDWDVMIQAEMQVASRPVARLIKQQSAWEARSKAVSDIQTRFGHLRDLVDKLNDASTLRAVTVTSSTTSVATASASGGATEGIHQIVVDRLATAEREVHAGVTPTETWRHALGVTAASEQYLTDEQISDAAGEDYKFVFQFGDEARVTVDLSAYSETGVTLEQLVADINTAAGYTAASASLEGGTYHLRLAAQTAGEGKSLAVIDENSVTALSGLGSFVQLADGEDGHSTLVGAGQFVYSYNGVQRTIYTTAETTLGDLVDLINNDADNPGITASTLEYEVDADHRFHLVLSGNQTGSDYAITVDAATTLAAFAPGAAWTQTQAASNSRIRVDGYPAEAWIERSGNSISDVIPGVTVTLQGTGTTTINQARNTQQLATDLGNLVSVYNGIVQVMKDNTGYDADAHVSGVLQGDSTVTSMLAQVRNALTGAVKGFDGAAGEMTMAVDIGLTIAKDGTMSLDTAKLNEALSDDYYGVLNLLGAVGKGNSSSQFVQFSSAGSADAGAYEVQVDFDAAGIVTAARIRLKGEAEWRDATVSGNMITGTSGSAESLLKLTAVADASKAGTAYTQDATIRIREGFAGVLYDLTDAMLKPTYGTFARKTGEYDATLERLAKQIEAQQDRLVEKEGRLKAKYARLEATLAKLDSQRGAFEALTSSLEANKKSDD